MNVPNRNSWTSVIGFGGLLLCCPSWALGQPPTAQQVKQAWGERQDKVKTLRCEWTARETVPKGSNSIGIRGAPEGNPPRDLLIDAKVSLILGGGKLRYTYDGQDWSLERGELVPRTFASAFDGKIGRSFNNKGGLEYPQQGWIVSDDRAQDASSLIVSPLSILCRGTDPVYRPFDFDAYEATGREVKIKDRPCVEFTRRSRTDERTDTLLLDRSRAYLLLRRTTTVQKTTTLQLTIDYGPDPSVGWVPLSWEYVVRLPGGSLLKSVQCSATKTEINPALSADDFAVPFPPGTWVSDQSSGTELQSVVQDDGREGKALPSSAIPTYEQLREAGPANRWRWLWIAIPSAVFVLAFVGLVWIKWRRRTARPAGAV